MIVTLDEGQRNCHGLKGQATKYVCVKFHDCRGHSVWENVNVWVFQDFQSATVDLTLDEGHSNWYGLKCLTPKYHCAKFHDCSGHSVWENVNVLVFQDFPSATVAMTLDEGHPKWYGLKGLATKYHCAKFHDCSGYSTCQWCYPACQSCYQFSVVLLALWKAFSDISCLGFQFLCISVSYQWKNFHRKLFVQILQRSLFTFSI